MEAVAIPNSLFALEDRNKLAGKVIRDYARWHAWTDVIMGLAAGVVPGGGIVATIAGVLIQPKAFYQPMVRKLAEIYSASPDDVTNGIVGAATGVGAASELLVNEFGSEFIQEILMEIAQEVGISAGIGLIPVIGKILGAGMDMVVARTLTWTVGAMATIYFLNGGQFIESRKDTYVLCKPLAKVAITNGNGIDLDDLPWKVGPLRQSMVKQLLRFVVATVSRKGFLNFVLSLLAFGRSAGVNADEIRGVLAPKEIPERLVDEVVQYAAGKPTGKAA